jgi:hypothetical protein
MLRITSEQIGNGIRLKLEGRLGGPWVNELERAWRRAAASVAPADIAIDISEISFADAEGRELLERICRQGASLEGSGCMCADLAERIKKASSKTSPRPESRSKGR